MATLQLPGYTYSKREMQIFYGFLNSSERDVRPSWIATFHVLSLNI